MIRAVVLALVLLLPLGAVAAEPLGINLEGFPYPFPVSMFPLDVWGHPARMAYMDVAPSGKPRGQAVLLLHGRNFPSSYWEGVIKALTAAGYRVIAPDQIGFNKSSKPEVAWSFDDAAAYTVHLLDSVHLAKVDVLGHSMGGMLAMRFARDFPGRVNRLVLESPLGLEDYRLYVPPVSPQVLYKQEFNQTAGQYLHYLMTAYGVTLPPEALKPFVEVRERIKGSADYPRWVHVFDSTFYAIWGQPVVDEIPLIAAPTLFMVGTRDRTGPGRQFAKPADRDRVGHIADLAKAVAPRMPDAHVDTFDTGHLIHLEQPAAFDAALLRFLGQ